MHGRTQALEVSACDGALVYLLDEVWRSEWVFVPGQNDGRYEDGGKTWTAMDSADAPAGTSLLPKSRPSPVCRVTRRAAALERRSTPGMPQAYLRRLLSRQSCYCFEAVDRPDRLATALFDNRGTT